MTSRREEHSFGLRRELCVVPICPCTLHFLYLPLQKAESSKHTHNLLFFLCTMARNELLGKPTYISLQELQKHNKRGDYGSLLTERYTTSLNGPTTIPVANSLYSALPAKRLLKHSLLSTLPPPTTASTPSSPEVTSVTAPSLMCPVITRISSPN